MRWMENWPNRDNGAHEGGKSPCTRPEEFMKDDMKQQLRPHPWQLIPEKKPDRSEAPETFADTSEGPGWAKYHQRKFNRLRARRVGIRCPDPLFRKPRAEQGSLKFEQRRDPWNGLGSKNIGFPQPGCRQKILNLLNDASLCAVLTVQKRGNDSDTAIQTCRARGARFA